tara:strand:+ start:8976 stop:9248 length:273 start_codon:yes stop_codon:yes gene_type:complete
MSKITLEIKKGSKVVKTKEIVLKKMNVWEDLKFNDLLLEHSKLLDKNLCERAGKVVKLCTGMTDEELADIGAEGIIQLFPLIIKNKAKKK